MGSGIYKSIQHIRELTVKRTALRGYQLHFLEPFNFFAIANNKIYIYIYILNRSSHSLETENRLSLETSMDISGSDYNTGFQTLRIGTLRTGSEEDMLYNPFLE